MMDHPWTNTDTLADWKPYCWPVGTDRPNAQPPRPHSNPHQEPYHGH